ncbi:MAG: hypothetical protein HOM11_05660 [Methylococcales bacterium]|nr:hypothetical protein [Methylococcales bacterium]MBT7444221.1 hypothetical protein [Methylococcales bacterium]
MIRRFLFYWSAKLPCRQITVEGKPYLERYYLGKVLGLTFYLHRFVDDDDERAVHDHPWTWALALILCGGYQEERVLYMDPNKGWHSIHRTMFPGRLNVIRPNDFHRVRHPKINTWTLFFHTKKMKDWGFLEKVEPQGILYNSHRPSGKHTNWWEDAPVGKDANRVPR